MRTIARLLELNAPSYAWVLNFVLRGADHHPIAQCLASQGYAIARDRNAYHRRRFAGAEERALA